MLKSAPTMIDVAKRVGVSRATVSMVVNDHPNIATATRKAVFRAMQEVGYVPPPPGRRRGRIPGRKAAATKSVGLVMIGVDPEYPVYGDFIRAAAATLADNGRDMALRILPARDIDAIPELGRRAAGLLLVGDVSAVKAESVLGAYPCVWALGDAYRQKWCDRVMCNNSALACSAAEYLVAHGCDHCVYIGGNRRFHRQRADAFRESVKNAGAKVDMLLVGPEFLAEAKRKEMDANDLLVDKFLAIQPAPTGMFLPSGLLPALRGLVDRGGGPEALPKVVCCDKTLAGGLPFASPAVIDVNPGLVAARAVEQLLWRSQNSDHPRVEILIEPTLIADYYHHLEKQSLAHWGDDAGQEHPQ